MAFSEQNTVAELAAFLGVSSGTVRRWIRGGRIQAVKERGVLLIPVSQEFILEQLRRRRTSSTRSPYTPTELKSYSQWHETLDQLVWLLKTSYASREMLKKRRFRLDSLFAAYIKSNKLAIPAIRRALNSPTPRRWRLIEDDLKRGWYNELAYCTPTRPSTLGLGFADVQANMDVSGSRFAFPSWPIIKAYYAAYFFLRSIALQKQPALRLEEHGAAVRVFKHNVVGAIDSVLWCFPLNIMHSPGHPTVNKAVLEQRFPHWRFAFARHPREPHPSPAECVKRLGNVLRRRSRRNGRTTTYGLFDLLHDFRVWVNYRDIDSMLHLWGGGYRAFLDMNLGALLFFIGGTAELAFIATRGAPAYVKQLQSVYELLTESNATLCKQFRASPLYQRHQIYIQLGLVREGLQLRVQEDPHAVSVRA
jgi:excisionase family DNA binding protein